MDWLWIIAIILLVAWLIGLVSFRRALGTFLHILLIAAIILLIIWLVSGA